MNDKGIDEQAEEITVSIQGMHCSACATRIERSLSKLPEVQEVVVSYPFRKAWIKASKQRLHLPSILAKIVSLGFQAQIHQASLDDLMMEKQKLRKRLIIAIMLTFPLLLTMVHHIPFVQPISPYLPTWLFAPWLQWILATGVQFFIGLPFYISAYYAIRERLANMDVLVVLGTTAAYLYSHYEVLANGLDGLLAYPLFQEPQLYFESSAVVITVVLIGKYIELSSAIKMQQQHEPFAMLDVDQVTIRRDGMEQTISLSQVKEKDVVIHRTGQIIAIDGIITYGAGFIDESLLTGESQPVYKKQGEKVWAGTYLTEGSIQLSFAALGQPTRLEQIRELVKKSQAAKTSIQRQVDKVMKWFVPTIILLSIMTGIMWTIAGAPTDKTLLTMLAVVLVACPCALGLAAPISLAIASSRLVSFGIIVKEANIIERLSQVKEMIFDKTGTLTEGRLKVSFVQTYFYSRQKVLQYVAALEENTKHPIAEAIVKYVEQSYRELEKVKVEQKEYKLGYGIKASINNRQYYVGNEKLLAELGVTLPAYVEEMVKQRRTLGETICYVIEQRRCIGVIGLIDQIKVSSPAAIKQLQAMGINLTIATGDHEQTSYRIAEQIGIKQVHASLTPEQKLKLINDKQKQQVMIAMVGDGWNDAPALASAAVGITMGSGTDGAIQASHITLLHNKLTQIPLAIEVSKVTLRNIKQNLMFALIYNMCMLPIAALGMLQPWMAGIAMSLSSLCVVFNSLALYQRLKRKERVLLQDE